MRKVTFILLGLLLINICAFAQAPDTLWTKMYGGPGKDECNSIQITDNGGYILAGITEESQGSGIYDFYIVKTDSLGDSLWTRSYGGSLNDECYSIQRTVGGNFIAAGYTESFGASGLDIYLVKIDSNGDTLWTRTYGGPGDEVCYSMLTLEDGTCVLAGYTDSFGAGEDDMYLLKVNSWGDLLWQQTFGDSLDDRCYSIDKTEDGGYILGGNIGVYGNWDPTDVYLIKTDSYGNLEWPWIIDIGLHDCCNSIQVIDEGEYILGGYTNVPYYDGMEIFLMKIDTWIGLDWVQIYDSGYMSYDEGKSVLQTSDSGYVLGGFSEIGCCRTSHHSKIIKTNSLGFSVWEYISVGGIQGTRQVCNSILQTTDGGLVFGGWIENNTWANFDMYLVKFAPEGATNAEEELPNFSHDLGLLNAFPNPFNPTTTINYSLNENSKVSLNIYNIQGQKVKQLVNDHLSAGQHSVIWNGKDDNSKFVSSGIYFYKLKTANFENTKRMILLK